MEPAELCTADLTEVAARIRERSLSPVALTAAIIDRIRALDGRLHGYACVLEEQALRRARQCETELCAGKPVGPLHGVPIAVKDLCAMAGTRTTCGSPVFAERVTDYDAAVVERLVAAGAVIVGKLNLTEFAYAGYHPDLEAPENPWAVGHWAGLSSSGSGVATAAGMCFAAIGTDTGGSIRYPSAANAVVGIKPTFGRTSRFGVFPLSHTLDHVGPLARSVRDAAVVLDVISAGDDRDPASLRVGLASCTAALGQPLTGLTVGVDEHYCNEGVSDVVAHAVSRAITELEALGAELRPIRLDIFGEVLSAWIVICAVDAAVAHACIDPAAAARYGSTFRELLEGAAMVRAVDYADAMVARRRLQRELEAVFEQVDAIACPALARPPGPIGDRSNEADHLTGSHLFTMPYSLSGNPSITLPCGFSSSGMPLALQLIGAWGADATLCRLAHAYEQNTDWHRCHPRLD